MWCVAELTPEYIENMEDTLGIYEKPYDPKNGSQAGASASRPGLPMTLPPRN